MLNDVYKKFNSEQYTPEKYGWVLEQIKIQAGETCLRMCETPVFISRSYADKIIQGAREIIKQSLSPALKEQLDKAVSPEFRMPSAPDRPTFFIVDFAVTKEGPRLIEMQAFASNLMFIPLAAKIYKHLYELGNEYQYLFCDVSKINNAIMGSHKPENVILMEINPWQQPSRRDFIVTKNRLGIAVVDVKDIIRKGPGFFSRKGDRLYYRNDKGKLMRINRIYNRVIPTEFKNLKLAQKTKFKFSDNLDVEWAGDPSWFLRISKYTLPYLKHPMVPETQFLDKIKEYPQDLENYVLKPVFFNAGVGVKLDITKADLDAIPDNNRHEYILMRKVSFEPFIPDLNGNMLNAEIRAMFVWTDKLDHVAFSARVMRGNDVNQNVSAWCGLTPVFVVNGIDD